VVLKHRAEPQLAVHRRQFLEAGLDLGAKLLRRHIRPVRPVAQPVIPDPQALGRSEDFPGVRRRDALDRRGQKQHAHAVFPQCLGILRHAIGRVLGQDLAARAHRAIDPLQAGLRRDLGRLLEAQFQLLVELAEHGHRRQRDFRARLGRSRFAGKNARRSGRSQAPARRSHELAAMDASRSSHGNSSPRCRAHALGHPRVTASKVTISKADFKRAPQT